MQVAPEQAAFLTFLTRLLDVRQAVEVGTFTGLSSLAIARGLADGGRLTCFDISEEYTGIARRYWARAGVRRPDRAAHRPGRGDPARAAARAVPGLRVHRRGQDRLPGLLGELVPRMRPGGVIAVDNVLRGGRVLAPQNADDRAIAAFNDEVLADVRVDPVMLPIADGLTLARVR